MALRVNSDDCIGCGACEFACPPGALTKTATFLGIFVIDPYTCDDCQRCQQVCPVDAIVVDTDWPECHGRGCPLRSSRLSGYECAVWAHRCPSCGDTLWRRSEDENWACPTCDLGMRVMCPKIHHLERAESLTTN
jgi:NAD-dependent dihydropyrimidine dehydrogenase PreA subunit